MSVSLTTLFCSPQDVWDLLSTEGVDLREDDHNLASGQIIQTTSDSPVGSTTVAVNPLPVALLNGAQLVFDGASMTVPIAVQLTAIALIGATSLSVQATGTDVPAGAQARDSGVNAATGARLLVGCRKGTSKVKLYCNQRYDDSQLKLCGTANNWAALVAAKYLCTRRAQGCPKGIAADYKEAVEEMRMVQAGQLALEDIGTRGVDWPTVTNITVRPGYNGMQARVEPNISEQTPTAYNQYIDWSSAVLLDF
jgi:hypothetical protein